MNKKGFTLIEMLVVIAIIAILVAIIIPTVMHATDKAAAASNAANLRSAKAELVTAYLADEVDEDEIESWEPAETIKWKECSAAEDKTGYDEDAGFAASYAAATGITVTYNGLDINAWAELAGETGNAD